MIPDKPPTEGVIVADYSKLNDRELLEERTLALMGIAREKKRLVEVDQEMRARGIFYGGEERVKEPVSTALT